MRTIAPTKILKSTSDITRSLQDEGKRRAVSAVKLEGAEVGPDVSLGKPFVFKCRPQSCNRVFFFCATSNQEMKRYSTDNKLQTKDSSKYVYVYNNLARHTFFGCTLCLR